MGGPTTKEIHVKQTIKFEIASLYGTKNGVKLSWSWDNCSLPISKCNKSGANSMKELPEAKKRLTKKFSFRLSNQAYL